MTDQGSTIYGKERIPVLEVKNVSKSYGKKQVLKNASFFTEESKITGIVGENGSGKTTLLKIIIGLLKPDSGKVVTHGKIGYCPQDQVVFNALTLHENFKYFAIAYGLKNKQNWMNAVTDLVGKFGLESYMDTTVSKLSGGTKQKLNLCLALMHSPDLIILDEPYAAFDWESYLLFWELVSQMKENGKSLLIVSHMIYDRAALDRIYELKEMQLICE